MAPSITSLFLFFNNYLKKKYSISSSIRNIVSILNIGTIELINFDKDKKYIEVILKHRRYNKKTIELYSYDDLNEPIFKAEYRTKLYKFGIHKMTSTNFVSDENYIAVADVEGKLQVYDKKTNEKYTYDTFNCNAVAIGYYDYKFDKKYDKFGYDFKKDDIYKEDVLVYNDGSMLHAISPVLITNQNTPFKRDKTLDFNAKIDTIQITSGVNNEFLISVLSNDQITIVQRHNDGTLTIKNEMDK